MSFSRSVPDRSWIVERVTSNRYLLSAHAEFERQIDGLSISDIEQVLTTGTLIEEYPEDKRGPSCLVFGKSGGRAIHVVVGRNNVDWLVVITVYIPEMPKWKSPTERNRP